MTASPPRSFIVAIDGPAAAGKGTLAKRVAHHFGFAHLDTGLLYRAIGLEVERAGPAPDEAQAAVAAARSLRAADLEDPAVRSDRAARAASRIATIPSVRAALLDFQRRFAAAPPNGAPGAVLDGRDIGSVVCPDADIKLFVTAAPEVRAARRLKELRERGLEAKEDRVLQEMRERDARDSSRSIAPLKPADDAIVIDTSGLSAEDVFQIALTAIGAVYPVADPPRREGPL